jgi:5-amino-6-(5-phospho-D-ribitylamino)uracil phosphatase
MSPVTDDQRWLIALDIDGTILQGDGTITDAVIEQVQRMRDAGHEIMLATGRGVGMTLPILDRLGLTSEYVISANGAITLKRDADAPMGWTRHRVETFDPDQALRASRSVLETAHFAIEDEHGFALYTEQFPAGSLGEDSRRVAFEELFGVKATRLVVYSPEHGEEEFLDVVEGMGLHKVAYNVGWTAWLDIAPEGVNKASALEAVRAELGIPRERCMAIGDGRNDIEMLAWAAEHGRGVAMGGAPEEVVAVASERTGTEYEDGVAQVFSAWR